MKRFFLALSIFLFLVQTVNGKIPFEIEFQTNSLNGSNLTFCILANNKIDVIKKENLFFRNGSLKLKGDIDQKARFASLSTVHNGKMAFKIFSIDSGLNSIKVDLKIKNNFPQLEILASGESNFISELVDTAFHRNLAIYRHASGLPKANTLDAVYNSKFKEEVLKIIESNPQNFGSLLALSGLSKMENSPQWAERIIVTMASLSPVLKSSSLFQEIKKGREALISGVRNSSAGQRAKIFETRDEKGVSFSNRTLADQNYLLAFSATWCIPCQHQLPLLKKVYERYKDSGLRVVYFNDDDDIDKWVSHIKNNNLEWINVSDRKKPGQSIVQKSFGINAVPTVLIVNSSGKIIYNSDQTDPGLTKLQSTVQSLYVK